MSIQRVRLEDLPAEMQRQARAQLTDASGRPRKFRNQLVEFDGEWFNSKWELRRYHELLEQQACGRIRQLRHHVVYPLHVMTPRGELARLGSYEADFVYERDQTHTVVEDTKSEPTRRHRAYQIIAKHFELEYDLKIIEVLRRRKPQRVHV